VSKRIDVAIRHARPPGSFTTRHWAAFGVAAIACEAVIAAAHIDPSRQRLLGVMTWFGYAQASLAVAVALLLAVGTGERRRRGRRPARRALVLVAVAAWGLTCLAMVLAPLATARAPGPSTKPHHAIVHLPGAALAPAHLIARWSTVIEVLIGSALITSVLAARVILRPARVPSPDSGRALQAARAIVEKHGHDSLSPFILRPDKAFEFAAGGVLAYRVIGETAVVSGDPIAPEDSAPEVLARFMRSARGRGWRVTLYGVSARHLPGYRSMGLRAICVGEEAVVHPERFTLQGRPVRKLRQSVHRVQRRGWEIGAYEGREIHAALEAEIDAIEASWRSSRRRVLGFAMGMGACEPGVHPGDLYLLARSPDGALHAVMRFISHCGKLSLDTMRRVGETPNGLNEAMVCRALEIARDRGVTEVSLNYAGLAHLVRHQPSGTRRARAAGGIAVALWGRRFQMQRLVRFNEKFSPEWRPRFLVYESASALPRSVFRVLQAEGYLPQRRRPGDPSRSGRRQLGSVETRVQGRLGR
jgi:lysyl-tRNA synthetase, class II